jgi:hypothetical protein
MTTFVIPIMLSHIGWWSFIFFGCMNFVVMPIIHFFYPETAGRSLEEVDLLFASDSLLVSKNMAEYNRRVAEAGGNIAVAARKLLDEVDGKDNLDPRRVSLSAVEDARVKIDAKKDHVESLTEKSSF